MPFVDLDGVEVRDMGPGWNVQFVHSERMTFAYWQIEPGAELPAHAHPHEQVATVMEGEFALTIDGETQVIRPGIVGVIPPNATHAGKALTACRILDVFCPVREDYR